MTLVFPLLSMINNMISKFKTPLTGHQWSEYKNFEEMEVWGDSQDLALRRDLQIKKFDRINKIYEI